LTTKINLLSVKLCVNLCQSVVKTKREQLYDFLSYEFRSYEFCVALKTKG